MDLRITDTIREQDKAAVIEGLSEYNLARIEDKSPENLGVYADDGDGRVAAGLIGHTHVKWLMIQLLWVAEEYRGRRLGNSILRQAEQTARERGCKYAFVDTFSFQAPAFYEKLGYAEVFTLEEFPVTGKRHYFTKTL
ncbi:MAG: GNAT family N-acetyltransferase [Oscillospiraceae bacterium]|nr:GNAT family N-acetyltransferase [Oscillospiraceae bacterium]